MPQTHCCFTLNPDPLKNLNPKSKKISHLRLVHGGVAVEGGVAHGRANPSTLKP